MGEPKKYNVTLRDHDKSIIQATYDTNVQPVEGAYISYHNQTWFVQNVMHIVAEVGSISHKSGHPEMIEVIAKKVSVDAFYGG